MAVIRAVVWKGGHSWMSRHCLLWRTVFSLPDTYLLIWSFTLNPFLCWRCRMCRGVVVPTLGIPTLWSVFSFFFFFLIRNPIWCYWLLLAVSTKCQLIFKKQLIHPLWDVYLEKNGWSRVNVALLDCMFQHKFRPIDYTSIRAKNYVWKKQGRHWNGT